MADIIAELVSLTGIDEDQATALLEAANYNLESAVELFFGNSSSNSTSDNKARLRRSSSPIDSAYGAGPVSPEVRAPDTIRTQQLLPSLGGSSAAAALGLLKHPGMAADILGMSVPGIAMMGGGAAGLQSSSTSNPFTKGVSKNSTKHQKKLAEMYSPPDDITFKGTLSQARDACRAEQRWLLVNVQDDAEFACHLLNRDVWRDESIRVVLSFSFVLWQAAADSTDGSNFLRLYETVHPVPMPYVAVVDPESGALLRRWTGPAKMTSETIMDKLMDFLDSNPKSFSGTAPKALLERRGSNSSTASTSIGSNSNSSGRSYSEGLTSSDSFSSSHSLSQGEARSASVSRSNSNSNRGSSSSSSSSSSSRDVVDISALDESPVSSSSSSSSSRIVGVKRERPVELDGRGDISISSSSGSSNSSGKDIVDFSLGLPIDRLLTSISTTSSTTTTTTTATEASSQKPFRVQFKLPSNKKVALEFDPRTSLLDVFVRIANEVSSPTDQPSTSAASTKPRHMDLLCGFPIASLLRTCRSHSSSSSSSSSSLSLSSSTSSTTTSTSSHVCAHTESTETVSCLIDGLRAMPAAGLISGQLVTLKTSSE